MIGWEFEEESYDIEFDDEGNTIGLVVYMNDIDLYIHPFEWEESDKRVATALWICLIHFKDSIHNLLHNHGFKKRGQFNIDIFPFSSFKENFSQYFPYQGVPMDEIEKSIQIEAIRILFAPQGVWLIIRDDIEKELFLDDNVMLGIIFGQVIFGLLVIICELELDKSQRISVKFTHEVIPNEPKIVTHATAMALMGMKRKE